MSARRHLTHHQRQMSLVRFFLPPSGVLGAAIPGLSTMFTLFHIRAVRPPPDNFAACISAVHAVSRALRCACFATGALHVRHRKHLTPRPLPTVPATTPQVLQDSGVLEAGFFYDKDYTLIEDLVDDEVRTRSRGDCGCPGGRSKRRPRKNH